MTEVFITDVRSKSQADGVIQLLKDRFPELRINIDLNDPAFSFPCGHSILRVEGAGIDLGNIISVVNRSGFLCETLEDKVCN